MPGVALLDSRLRGNDRVKRVQGFVPAGNLRVSLRYTLFYSPKIGCQGVDDTMTMQQNAAGVWGVPRSSILPPRSKIRLRRSGGQGVDTDGARVSQQNDPSSRASNHMLADVK